MRELTLAVNALFGVVVVGDDDAVIVKAVLSAGGAVVVEEAVLIAGSVEAAVLTESLSLMAESVWMGDRFFLRFCSVDSFRTRTL